MTPLAIGQRRRVWRGEYDGVIGHVSGIGAGMVALRLPDGKQILTWGGYTEVV